MVLAGNSIVENKCLNLVGFGEALNCSFCSEKITTELQAYIWETTNEFNLYQQDCQGSL